MFKQGAHQQRRLGTPLISLTLTLDASNPPSPPPKKNQQHVVGEAVKLLPKDAYRRISAHGKTYLALTFPSPNGAAPAVQRLVGNFTTTEDLVAAIDASTYIPMYSGPRVTTE